MPLTCRASASRTCLPRGDFDYTFEHITDVIDRLTEMLGLDSFALYVFDYGAPVGFRIAVRHPERITAIISQNGNAYEEGLSDGWNPIQAYWKEPSTGQPGSDSDARAAADDDLAVHAWCPRTRHGSARTATDSTTTTSLAAGADEIQLDLFLDYASNVALYPAFQRVLPHQQAAPARGVGQERPVLPARRGRSLQARHPRRRHPFRKHGSLRPGNPRRGDRTAISEFLTCACQESHPRL